MKLFKNLVLALFFVALSSCGAYQYTTAKKESNKATKEQQQQVKNQVMKLLEEEYKQPFKLEDFSYKYERHWVDSSCQMSFCEMEKYGTYYFKVKAIDNPIILMDFKIDDDKKETVKDVIDSFKKNQLKEVYCVGLIFYYSENIENNTKVKEPITSKNRAFCDKNYIVVKLRIQSIQILLSI